MIVDPIETWIGTSLAIQLGTIAVAATGSTTGAILTIEEAVDGTRIVVTKRTDTTTDHPRHRHHVIRLDQIAISHPTG